ncbi:hypothetical protein SUDANB180_03358 [Streptomyces sp. enrichment culture]
MPVTPQRQGWVSWAERERYAVVYPCSGVLAGDGGRTVPAGLSALLGPARAGVLVLLRSPLSTTQLTAVTGQGLGSVGRHLKVLREAGLVERRRAGRTVLYVRTTAGDVLVEASGPQPGQADASRPQPGGAEASGPQASRAQPGGAEANRPRRAGRTCEAGSGRGGEGRGD